MMSPTVPRVVVPLTLMILVGALRGPDGWTGLGSARAQVASEPGSGPQLQPTDPDARREDRAAIRAAMQSFVKAFESGDAKAVAGHWTAEGEYQGEEAGTIHGREALERAYSGFFAKTPKVQAEIEPESLRFVSRDNAIEEGTVTIRRGPSEPAIDARYSALFVREDGRWRMALLRETPGEEASLRDLGWLVGDWKSTGQETEVRTTYSWDDHKKFLQVRFTIKEKDRTLGGSQVLGKDPATGELRSWTFEAEGGIGEAVWSRDGDHWVVDSTGTLADGSTLTATNIFHRVDDDTFTWQSIDRTLDDAELPDLPPVKVSRIKPAK
jgi:uncharacterized protein (TIGR02246 family)